MNGELVTTAKQCDQIEQFLKLFGKKILNKVVQIFGDY